MSPYTPNQRPYGRERSHSFKSNKINSSSVPHSSMGMSRGSYNARNKKNSKFNFFKQFKDKKEEKKKGKRNKQAKDSGDRLRVQDIILEEPFQTVQMQKDEELGKSRITSKSGRAPPKKDAELSEVFDIRASDPIHVNNLKMEAGFQIEKKNSIKKPKL